MINVFQLNKFYPNYKLGVVPIALKVELVMFPIAFSQSTLSLKKLATRQYHFSTWKCDLLVKRHKTSPNYVQTPHTSETIMSQAPL